jgi:hypothetical protein
MSAGRAARLALMISPADGVSHDDLTEGLRERASELGAACGPDARVRMGVRDLRHVTDAGARGMPQPVDAAVEVTMPEGSLDELAHAAGGIGRTLEGLVDPEGTALTIGTTHHMVPVREGRIFLSLAFQRSPGTTIEQFRDWWFHQHASVAIPLLGPELLAYDQVHVDRELAEKASVDAGIRYHPYDAYDNLTWASMGALAASMSKPGSAEEMYEDEVGHIDHSTNRGSMMNVI